MDEHEDEGPSTTQGVTVNLSSGVEPQNANPPATQSNPPSPRARFGLSPLRAGRGRGEGHSNSPTGKTRIKLSDTHLSAVGGADNEPVTLFADDSVPVPGRDCEPGTLLQGVFRGIVSLAPCGFSRTRLGNIFLRFREERVKAHL
jgi:hypothetical protein